MLQDTDDAVFRRGVDGRASLAICAHDRLVMRDDARLDRRRATTVNHDHLVGLSGTGLAQLRAQALARPIISDDTCDGRAHAERDEVCQHIRRPAQMHRLAPHIHDRHRRFGRDARHFAPHKLVQHQVAEHHDRHPVHAIDDLSGASLTQLNHKQVISNQQSVISSQLKRTGRVLSFN